MPRGGKRTGTPGAQYGNRTDLQQGPRPVMRVPGQAYGAQAEQVRAQQALPTGPAPSGTGSAAPGAPAAPNPTQVVPINAPTMRPDEPVTAGLGQMRQMMNPLATAAAALNILSDDDIDNDTARLRALVNAQLGNSAAP